MGLGTVVGLSTCPQSLGWLGVTAMVCTIMFNFDRYADFKVSSVLRCIQWRSRKFDQNGSFGLCGVKDPLQCSLPRL